MISFRNIFIIVLVFVGIQLKAQNNISIDSILLVAENSDVDSAKIYSYSYLALILEEESPDESIKYAKYALALAEKINDIESTAQAYNLLGRTYSYINSYSQSEKHLMVSLRLFKGLDNKLKIAEVYNNIGILFYYQNKYEDAVGFLESSAKYYKELNDTLGSIHTYNNIGLITYSTGNNVEALTSFDTGLWLAEQINDEHSIVLLLVNRGIVYDRMGNKSKAISDYYQSLEICEKIGDLNAESCCLNNIADSYLSGKDYDKALEFYTKSFEIDIKRNNRIGAVISLNNMGDVYRIEKKYDLAIKTFNEAKTISIEIDNSIGLARSLCLLGRIYFTQGNFNEANESYNEALAIRESLGLKSEIAECLYDIADLLFAQQKYQQSLKALLKAIDYKLEIDSNEDLDSYYFLLSKIYAKQQKYQKAYKSHLQYKVLSDSLYSAEAAQEITKVQMEYDYNKEREIVEIGHQQESRLYEYEIKFQKTLRNYLIGGLVVVLILLVLIIRLYSTNIQVIKKLRMKNEIISKQKTEIEKIVDELQIANETKDKFFSIIAHDLKGPFNVIIGFSEILSAHYDEFDEQSKKEFIANINGSAKQTYELVVNLLEWARSQTHTIEFKPESVSVQQLISNNIGLLKLQAKNKNIYLKFDENQVGINVFADQYMINSVLRNLISNSIKFTEKGGVSIKVEKEAAYCRIFIEDTGVGINKVDLKDLFQIEKSKSTKGTAGESGTGLGLVLCKDFIEKNSGQISVESEEHKGSIFSFILPLA